MSPPTRQHRIVYITAGAGGMYCGSCIRDNALAAGLESLGWDVVLLPLYTPIRVDGADRSVDQVFFGGINVYLQQKVPFFRYLPAFFDRWLDNPSLVRRVASKAVSVSASELGAMTLSMVRGEDGHQRKEVRRLVSWFKEYGKPDLICLTNLLVGGAIPALKRELGVPVYVTLQGDDLFLDELQEPWKSQVLAEMRRLAREADGFVTFSAFYRDRMAELFGVEAGKFRLTPLGIPVEDYREVYERRRARVAGESEGAQAGGDRGKTVGYLARIAPEKGFDVAVDSFIRLAPDFPGVRMRAAGWLAEKDRAYCAEQEAKIARAGLADRYERVDLPDAVSKADFLASLDLFCVPTRFLEPKGLYLLEAMACGLPFVAPERGAFPDLVDASGGGLLAKPEDPADVARQLGRLLSEPGVATACSESGRAWVAEHGDLGSMAKATAAVFEEALVTRRRW